MIGNRSTNIEVLQRFYRGGFILVYLFLLSFIAFTGCNTMEGVGKDVEKTGKSLKKSAEKNKTY